MKKVLIPVVAFILVIVGILVYFAGQRLDQAGYDADVVTYGAMAVEGSGMTADVDGETVALPDWKLDGLVRYLTIAASYRKPASPDPDGALETLTIHLGGGSQITLWRMDAAGDATVLQFTRPGKTYCFSLQDYKLFYWVKTTITA